MNNLIRIQGKVIEVKPAKTGYYVTVQTTGKRQRAFSQWKLKEGVYSLTLRQDNEYFFIVGYQGVEQTTKEIEQIGEELRVDNIYQPYENKDKQNDRQTIRELEARLKQAEALAQQWENAYYNQRWMLKEAQRNAHQRTVKARIQAIENKPGKKSKQDLDYLNLLTKFSQECQRNWAWLGAD